MKNFIVMLLCMAWCTIGFAQNLIPNPSFENVSGIYPYDFYLGEVADWHGMGAYITADHTFDCTNNGPVFSAEDGIYFTKFKFLNRGIATELTEPIYPYQKLNLQFYALVPFCQINSIHYKVLFYVSNVAPVNSQDGSLPGWNQLLKIGEVTVDGSNSWVYHNKNLIVNPLPYGQVPCSYKYLYITYVDASHALTGAEIPDNIVLLDNFSLTPCTSTISAAIAYNVDNDGICSKVKFTAKTSPAGTHYLWDFGDGTCAHSTGAQIYHTYSGVGTYTVTLRVIDQNGCIAETKDDVWVDCLRCQGINAAFTINGCSNCRTISLVDPKTSEVTIIGYKCDFSVTDNSTPSNGASITTWEWNGTPYHSISNPMTFTVVANVDANGDANGSICLQIQDSNGCYDFVCQPVALPCASEGRYHTKPAGSVLISPNPADAVSSITYPLEDAYVDLKIFDMQGKLRLHLPIEPTEGQKTIDLTPLENGIYIFTFIAADKQQNQKVVVQH